PGRDIVASRQNVGMGAIGGYEVDDRGRRLEIGREVRPVRVRLDEAGIGRRIELLARLVERRHAGVAAPRDIDRGKVERQAEQVVAQRIDDEFVDFIAMYPRHATEDRAGSLVLRELALEIELER